MSDTIEIDVPGRTLVDELVGALGAHGLEAEVLEGGDRCALRVGFAKTEQDRLVGEATRAIEAWLDERRLPLVVQRANGGCVLRPPGD